MTKPKKFPRYKIAVLVLGLLYAGIDLYVSKEVFRAPAHDSSGEAANIAQSQNPMKEDKKEQIMNAFFRILMVTLTLYMVQEITELGHEIKNKGNDNSAGLKKGSIMRNLYEGLTDELEFSILPNENELIVKHRDLAVSSYLDFWDILIAEQEHGISLTIHAIHSGNFGIWRKGGRTSELLLRKQDDFLKAGGKIQRVLCKFESDTIEDIKEVGNQMTGLGIEVRYYDISSGHLPGTYDHTWDFALVVEKNETAIWDTKTEDKNLPVKTIKRAIYTKNDLFERTNIKELWRNIWERSSLSYDQIANGRRGTRMDFDRT